MPDLGQSTLWCLEVLQLKNLLDELNMQRYFHLTAVFGVIDNHIGGKNVRTEIAMLFQCI